MILISAFPFLTGPRWISENSCSANELNYSDSDPDPQGALTKLMFQSWDTFLSCLVTASYSWCLSWFDSISYGNWLACSETSRVLLAKHFNTSCLEGPFPKLSHFPAAVCQRQHSGKESLRIWFCPYRQQIDDPFKLPCVCPVICLSLTSKHKLRSYSSVRLWEHFLSIWWGNKSWETIPTTVLCFIVRSTQAPPTSSEIRNGPKCLLVKYYWLLVIARFWKGPFSYLKVDTFKIETINMKYFVSEQKRKPNLWKRVKLPVKWCSEQQNHYFD